MPKAFHRPGAQNARQKGLVRIPTRLVPVEKRRTVPLQINLCQHTIPLGADYCPICGQAVR